MEQQIGGVQQQELLEGRWHASCSNFYSYKHERRGPAWELSSSGTSECGRHGDNSFRLEPGNCAILMWWLHTATGQRIKALRKRPHSVFFLRSSRKLEEVTPRYGCVGCYPAGDAVLTLYEHVYMGQQFDNLGSTFLFEVYIKSISSNHVSRPSLSHTICVSIHVVYIRVYIHIVLKICSGSSHDSHLDTTIKFDRTIFFWSVIPLATVSQWVLFLSTIPTIKLP